MPVTTNVTLTRAYLWGSWSLCAAWLWISKRDFHPSGTFVLDICNYSEIPTPMTKYNAYSQARLFPRPIYDSGEIQTIHQKPLQKPKKEGMHQTTTPGKAG